MHTILFVGGGSLGHIAPSIAVWHACKEVSNTVSAHFVCSMRDEEKEFLEKEKLPYSQLHAPRLSFSFLWKFPAAVRSAGLVLDRVRPSVVFCKGGYVSVPLCLAAQRRRIPIVLHESDAVSGRANTLIARWAKTVCSGFPLKQDNKKYIVTGNPVRASVQNGSRAEGLRLTGLSGKRPILLILGGSQGAKSINIAIADMLPKILQLCDVCHITGHNKESVHKTIEGYWQTAFVHDQLAHLYAITDIALSRAGGGAIAELAANHIPTILVPLRGVGHDHQQKNVNVLSKHGACVVIQQTHLDDKLFTQIDHLLAHPDQRKKMTETLSDLHPHDAALQIAKILLEHLAKSS